MGPITTVAALFFPPCGKTWPPQSRAGGITLGVKAASGVFTPSGGGRVAAWSLGRQCGLDAATLAPPLRDAASATSEVAGLLRVPPLVGGGPSPTVMANIPAVYSAATHRWWRVR
jgi:hypothetical protein